MGLLEFILLFILGVTIGAVLDFIFLKREKKLKSEKEALTSEIEKLNGDIKHLKDRFGFLIYYFAGDTREFTIIENYKSYDVVLRIRRFGPYREENIPIKRFYFKNDIEHAKSCAQELLDALNRTN